MATANSIISLWSFTRICQGREHPWKQCIQYETDDEAANVERVLDRQTCVFNAQYFSRPFCCGVSDWSWSVWLTMRLTSGATRISAARRNSVKDRDASKAVVDGESSERTMLVRAANFSLKKHRAAHWMMSSAGNTHEN